MQRESWSDVIAYFGIGNTDHFHMEPRYNIASSQMVAAVVSDGRQRRIGSLRWGLIPSWSETENTRFKTINARAETILVKPTFKDLVRRRRAVVVGDGFYEWRQSDKQPFRITLKDRPFFGFAALWDTWTNPKTTDKVSSCTIITCRPNVMMSGIHQRQPVILSPGAESIWLNRDIEDTDTLTAVLEPYPDNLMHMYPVSRIVGDVRNDLRECIEPWE